MRLKSISTIITVLLIILVLVTILLNFYLDDFNWACQLELIVIGLSIGLIQLVNEFIIYRSTNRRLIIWLTVVSAMLLLFYCWGIYYFLVVCPPACF